MWVSCCERISFTHETWHRCLAPVAESQTRQFAVFERVQNFVFIWSQESNALSISLELQSSNPGETAALRARCASILVEVKVSCAAIRLAILCRSQAIWESVKMGLCNTILLWNSWFSLGVQNQVLSVLDKEASQVMAALSHVIEKVKCSFFSVTAQKVW